MIDYYTVASLHHDWTPQMAKDIDAAVKSITLSTLSFNYPHEFTTSKISRLIIALTAAAARGVNVKVYLPAPSISHPATLKNLSSANKLHASNVTARLVPMPNLLHAKTLTIDDRLLWCGSGNWTQAATTHNREAYVRLVSPNLAIAQRQALEEIDAEFAARQESTA